MALKTLSKYWDRRVLCVLILGLASGTPIALIGSTLTWWLDSISVSLTTIGLYAYARTPYSFKFGWSPVVDSVHIPFLSRWLGQRRAWGMLIQLLLIAAIIALGHSDPAAHIWTTALLALLVGFLSASQDIVIDAFRIELFRKNEQELGATVASLGWRVGSLISGGAALVLSKYVSWGAVYTMMAGLVFLGFIVFLLSKEERPRKGKNIHFLAWVRHAVIAPLQEFITRPSAWWILIFILLYKVCDAYLGQVAFPFYRRVGFTPEEVFGIVKGVGTVATLAGFALGGLLVTWIGIARSLWWGAILQIISNLAFAWQAHVGHHVGWLAVTITFENVTAALSLVAFTTYLSQLCHRSYTATQYALLTSLMAFPRDVITSSSGYVAEHMSWPEFFIFSSLLGIPALILIRVLNRKKLF